LAETLKCDCTLTSVGDFAIATSSDSCPGVQLSGGRMSGISFCKRRG